MRQRRAKSLRTLPSAHSRIEEDWGRSTTVSTYTEASAGNTAFLSRILDCMRERLRLLAPAGEERARSPRLTALGLFRQEDAELLRSVSLEVLLDELRRRLEEAQE